jgi:signal transduction histidine kinase/CheY-like chemotaxis protein
MIAKSLHQARLTAEVVTDVNSLCREWDEGAGAALIAEEALSAEPLAGLVEAIQKQPVWSDFPVVLMTTGGKTTRTSTAIVHALVARGNVTLLERPLRILTLVSAMQAALRARRRQHEVRRFLEATEKGLKQRDQFLAMLGHELRNPLVPIRNGIQLLSLRPRDGETVDRVREMMDRQLTHMVRIIDDLLDVSRITQGKVVLHRERLEFSQFVRRAVEDRRDRLQASGLTVEIELPRTPVWITGDPTRLTQIIDNLLENAGKFSERGGRVCVRLVVEAWQAVLSIRDTGVGIDPDLMNRLFEVFTQADRSLERSQGGLGLGLAVVKGLVELHGGSVRAASEGLGKGAEFIISLPVDPEAPAQSVNSEDTSLLQQSSPRRLHVLVVEDNRDSAQSFRLLLNLFGYDVTLAYSGDEALAAVGKSVPDVVLCDIGLPGMDGFGVVDALRHNPRMVGTRLIAVTGYGQEDDRRKALEAGFDEHMVKPVDPQKLLHKLNGLRCDLEQKHVHTGGPRPHLLA